MRNGNVDQTYIALTCADGTVAVMGFVTCEYLPNGEARWRRLATKPEIDKEIKRLEEGAFGNTAKVPIQSWRFMDDSELEAIADRDMRDALVDDGRALKHDMAKARELYRARVIRPERNAELASLDAEYLKADEAGDTKKKKAISARKQILRDAPSHPDIEAAASVDELKRVRPL